MRSSEAHKILGLKTSATKKEIKKAFRKLALKYHPDHNPAKNAESRFQDITTAYHYLLDADEDEGMEDYLSRVAADDIIRKERQKVRERVEKKRQKKKEAEERFRKSELYDVLLLLRYISNALVLVFSFAAVITPFVLAIVIEPVVLAATFFFVIIGTFLLWYIYERRHTWFKLGKFNTSWGKLKMSFRMPVGKVSGDTCCYLAKMPANGKACSIELIKILDIKVASFGALNHQASYKRKVKKVVLPRSLKAQYWHRVVTYIKLVSILGFAILFPVSSIIWRIISGIISGGLISFLVLKVVGVKSKTSYLFTSALIVKSLVWMGALLGISYLGPGFDIHLSEYIYLVLAGLFLILDMLFDLIFGLLPFYKKMQEPVLPQGKVLHSLYKDGFQNFQEFPVYSVFFPLMRWLF
jgi:hypothetical protein